MWVRGKEGWGGECSCVYVSVDGWGRGAIGIDIGIKNRDM